MSVMDIILASILSPITSMESRGWPGWSWPSLPVKSAKVLPDLIDAVTRETEGHEGLTYPAYKPTFKWRKDSRKQLSNCFHGANNRKLQINHSKTFTEGYYLKKVGLGDKHTQPSDFV